MYFIGAMIGGFIAAMSGYYLGYRIGYGDRRYEEDILDTLSNRLKAKLDPNKRT